MSIVRSDGRRRETSIVVVASDGFDIFFSRFSPSSRSFVARTARAERRRSAPYNRWLRCDFFSASRPLSSIFFTHSGRRLSSSAVELESHPDTALASSKATGMKMRKCTASRYSEVGYKPSLILREKFTTTAMKSTPQRTVGPM